MQQILIIAKQTFRESVRNKILIIFIILSLIAICCTFFMPAVGGVSEKLKVVESMCLRFITFFGMLAAILLSASSIPADIEGKLLWTVITKPISRANLIFGKITGFIYIIGLLLIIMGGASYALIKFTALKQNAKDAKVLVAREKYDASDLRVTGESAKIIGDYHWIGGGGKGTSVWEFKGLRYEKIPDDFEIETKLFAQSGNRAKKIPVIIKIINPYAGTAKTETIEVYNSKPATLKIKGEALEGSKKITVVMAPKNTGDFIGMKPDSLKIFLGEKSFEYNFLKGLAIISLQFVLMIVIATLGSTFLSLPVNILFCLFIFFCGNIIDFMRDLSTVISVFETHEHDHGISTVVKKPGDFVILFNYVLKNPLMVLSYILPNFKNFNVGHYFIESVNIPFKNIFASFGYTILYVLFCLPVSFMIFNRREIA